MPRRCAEPGCKTQPCFGLVMGRPTHCQKCSLKLNLPMTNVNKPRCADERGCSKAATWGLPGGRAVRCPDDALPGMVDVVNIYARLCEEPGCTTQSTFGLVLGCPTHCKKCKTDLMCNVIRKRCGKCDERAMYGFEDGCPTCCGAHKEDGMWDVVSTLCDFRGCKKYPIYGLKQGHPTRCGDHPEDGMTNVKNKRCEKCSTFAFFGLPGARPTHCETHAEKDMVNVASKQCVTCMAAYSYNPAYDGRCFRCFVYEFPESPMVRNYKTKEAATLQFLRDHFSAFDMREDKKVPDGCSKYRPDLIFDLGDRVIIIEVDEDQHRDYEKSCEIRRLMSLFVDVNGRDCLETANDLQPAALAGRPLVIIRFNPDDYSPCDGKASVPSCWKRTPKTGLLSILDVGAWQGRLEVLRSSVAAHMSAPVESLKDVHEVRLFYDGYSR